MSERPYEFVSTPEGMVLRVRSRGTSVLSTPILNRGTAFTPEERRALGLVGLLPGGHSTIDGQVRRVYAQFQRQPDALAKNVYLANLRDRNEVLFYRLLSDHLAEMLPIVYTPTVGQAIERYSHEYRRPRGVFLSVDHPDLVETSLRNYGLGSDDVDLIVATDAEGILGIGDWGVGGIDIAIGKLAVYIAAAGIHPQRVIPVVLDTGTDNMALLNDRMYLGARHARVRGQRYDDFVDTYVQTATKLFPHALLHWEDLGAANARRILQRYADQCCTFNDDMQGTAAVVLATFAPPSTRTARAPRGWSGRRRARPSGRPGPAWPTSGWSSTAPARPAWASRTCSGRSWSPTAWRPRRPPGGSGAWAARGSSPTTDWPTCTTSRGRTPGRRPRSPAGPAPAPARARRWPTWSATSTPPC